MNETTGVQLPAVAILGAGSMGQAILGGLLAPHVRVDGGVRLTTRSRAHADELARHGQVHASASEDDPQANARAAEGAGIVVLAVKPGQIIDVTAEVAPVLDSGCVVISVAVGVPTSRIEQHLSDSAAVVRAMPNTPAFVGRGVTGISAGSHAGDADMALARSLFGTVGDVVEVDEEQIDALSTISGSGPAYVFYLMEQLTATAIDKGFDPETASQLVNGTFRGATELQASTGRTPAELRRQVTSPKGTTERALGVLEAGGVKELFDRATDAALARARELGL